MGSGVDSWWPGWPDYAEDEDGFEEDDGFYPEDGFGDGTYE